MSNKYTCKDCANFGQHKTAMYCGSTRIPEIKENAEICDKFVYDGSNTIKNLKEGDILYIKRVQNLLPYVQNAWVKEIDSDNNIWVILEYGNGYKLSELVGTNAVYDTYEHAYKAACFDVLNSSLALREELNIDLNQIQLRIRANEKRIGTMKQEIEKQED